MVESLILDEAVCKQSVLAYIPLAQTGKPVIVAPTDDASRAEAAIMIGRLLASL